MGWRVLNCWHSSTCCTSLTDVNQTHPTHWWVCISDWQKSSEQMFCGQINPGLLLPFECLEKLLLHCSVGTVLTPRFRLARYFEVKFKNLEEYLFILYCMYFLQYLSTKTYPQYDTTTTNFDIYYSSVVSLSVFSRHWA